MPYPPMMLFLLPWCFVCTAATSRSCHAVDQFERCGGMVCVAYTCQPCANDLECRRHSLECDIASGICEVTPVSENILKAVTAFCGAAGIIVLGTIGGLGGGAALMPWYAIVLGLPPSVAVAASLATIAGQGVLNVPLVIVQRHPTDNRPLVNYQLLSLWMPLATLGTLLGTVASGFWGTVTRGIGQIVVLCAMSVLTFIIGHQSKTVAAAVPAERIEGDERLSMIDGPSKLLILAAMAIGVATHTALHSVVCGEFWYWFTISIGLGLTLHLYLDRNLSLHILSAKVKRRLIGPNSVHFPINARTTCHMPFLSGFAGFLSVILGIGTATISGPLMLAGGLRPNEVSATGGVMTFIIALQSSIVTFSSSAILSLIWFSCFGLAGITGAFLGRVIIMPRLGQHHAREYIIVMCVTTLLVLGLLLTLQYSSEAVVDAWFRGTPLWHGQLCPETEPYGELMV